MAARMRKDLELDHGRAPFDRSILALSLNLCFDCRRRSVNFYLNAVVTEDKANQKHLVQVSNVAHSTPGLRHSIQSPSTRSPSQRWHLDHSNQLLGGVVYLALLSTKTV